MVVFRRSETLRMDDDRIDVNMSKILKVLDGQRSLASIAFSTGMNMSDFQKAIKELISMDFIEPVERENVSVG